MSGDVAAVGTAGKKRNAMVEDTWYVAFDDPNGASEGYYVRNTKTFRSEEEARQFARTCLMKGCNVSAGTLNPHFPKRTIGSPQVENWLNSG